MLNDKNSFNHDNRNLSEVFRELQEMQKNPNSQANNYKKYEKEQKSKRKKELSSISHAQNIRDSFRQERRVKTNDLKLSQIIIGCGILIVGLAVFFPKSASFQESYAKEVEEIIRLAANIFEENIGERWLLEGTQKSVVRTTMVLTVLHGPGGPHRPLWP